jgi:hypothetical protein
MKQVSAWSQRIVSSLLEAAKTTLRALFVPAALTVLVLFSANTWTVDALLLAAALMFGWSVPVIFVISFIFRLMQSAKGEQRDSTCD